MSDAPRRHCFVIEAADLPDTLVRVLTLFAVQPASLATVEMARRERGCWIRVEADGLDDQRAETVVRRLGGLAIVRTVGLGWRDAIPAAA